MSRTLALLAVLTNEPSSTSALYRRVGYADLARLGLIPYDAFRAELVRLLAAGLATSEVGHDGSTVWRLTPPIGDQKWDQPTPPAP